MNSDSDSDWESMPEAPPVTNIKSIDKNSHSQQKDNGQIERANIIAQEAAVKHHSRNNQQCLEESIQDDRTCVKT
jgi:hypothetical protein